MTGRDVEPGTGITVRRDGLFEFLRTVARHERTGSHGRSDPAPPVGLCLLSGRIVARNLRERLVAERIPTDLVATTTVQDLARDLVTNARGRRARVLDPPARKRGIEAVLDGVGRDDGPLGRFARRMPDGADANLADAVAAELDEYYRCTDAGADSGGLLEVIDDVAADHPFAAETTRESVRAFQALDEELAGLVADRNEAARDLAFGSRSHLVGAARRSLDVWEDATGDPDWVAMATVGALDSPTLRLLVAIARKTDTPVVVFAGPGTADPFARRIAAATNRVPVRRKGWDRDPSTDGVGTRTLLAAATDNDRVTAPPGVRTVAVPDRRRAVEYAVRATTAGAGNSEAKSALLVAPDASEYRTYLRDVALTRDRPYRVETRREVRTLPAFRAMAATVELLAAADEGAVAPRDVLEPLRLGICPPDARAIADSKADDGDEDRDWPLSPSTIRNLEALFGRDGTKPFPARRSTAADADPSVVPASVEAFLAWVDRRRSSPPGDGAQLRALCSTLLDAYVAALRDEPVRTIEGVAVETGRARVAAKHPAHGAARVREAAATAARTYDWLVGPLDRRPGWQTAVAAVREGAGSETYGLPPEDADAVEVVDAGNAHFRRADVAFVLGLAAERFPRTPRRATFLHRSVRDALHRRREERPFLYLDGRTPQYERDLDAYASALSVARERVTLVTPYKDEEGRDVAPSPFVETLSVPERRHTRVDVGDWIALGDGPRRGPDDPGSDTNSDHPDRDGETGTKWKRLEERLSDKECLRAVAHLSDRPAGRGPDRATLSRFADRVDDPEDRRRVRRRLDGFERYRGSDDE
jgi:hypothetical protein